MKFKDLLTGKEYDTSNYLEAFVDELTGEVKPQMVCLNKRVRKLWFRSKYPEAFIQENTRTKHSIPLDLSILSANANLTADDIIKLSKARYTEVLAQVQIIVDGKIIAVNEARRGCYLESDDTEFKMITEAAVNAAQDRCFIDLGFIVPEEIQKSIATESSDNPKSANRSGESRGDMSPSQNTPPQFKAIADIEALVESDADKNTSEVGFDIHTPVEEILPKLSPADARAYVFTFSKYKGKTVGEVYESDKDKSGYSGALNWFASRCVGKDNILVAACLIINKNKG